MLSKFCKPKPVSAKLVRRNNVPCLLAAFNTSSPPLIWQFDLEKMSNYTITLREREGEWDLGVLLPQGTFTVVAHFDERADGEHAYNVIQKALVSNETTARRWLRWAFIALLILITAGVIRQYFVDMDELAMATGQVTAMQGLPTVQGADRQNKKPGEIETGVPVTADDVLQAPAEP